MAPDQHPASPSLYLPEMEHDACGIGFIADLTGKKSHQLIQDALTMLQNMEHRGACGCDPQSGDGAGILIQMPDAFLRAECQDLQISLPPWGQYGVGMIFFPQAPPQRAACRKILEKQLPQMGFELLGYRKPEVNPEGVGVEPLQVAPHLEQMFVAGASEWSPEQLERKLFALRRIASHQIKQTVPGIGDQFYFTSFSYKTLVYKGQLRTDQLSSYFPDLHDPRIHSGLALIHSRFSTNTFPQWRLAQPFRYLAHNGEINTIRGNVNWMGAKEMLMESPYFSPEEFAQLLPICDGAHSDSRNLDSVVELLVMCGRSLPHVMMMLIPEAWQDNALMPATHKAFYEYHATLMEPWDGPASLCFTDGNLVGATLDRNGLRPSRYCITLDGRLILASEAGALPVPPDQVKERGRLQPGRMLVADLAQGRIIRDEELKDQICKAKPYGQWLKRYRLKLRDLPSAPNQPPAIAPDISLLQRQQLFGISAEEIRMVLLPIAQQGKEPIGSMGADTPLAALSDHSQHISHYFKQLFAQVSNPPIDPIRERAVMSLRTWIGGAKNVLDQGPKQCRQIAIQHPVLNRDEIERIRQIQHPDYRAMTLEATFSPDEGLEAGLDRLCAAAEQALQAGTNILIVSDRNAREQAAPIPMLMAAATLHHHLIHIAKRHQTALIAETGDAREVHHFATLIGYGVIAIHPYLAFDSLDALAATHPQVKGIAAQHLHRHYIQAINKGLLKVFSKMGISTLQSYHGAQIFEVLGLGQAVVDRCFKGSISRIGGLGFAELTREVLMRHTLAFPQGPATQLRLETGGVYQWRRDGEAHLLDPETIHLLQFATRRNRFELYQRYADRINIRGQQGITLRGLLDFVPGKPIPLEEVETAAAIFRRFATGAMSFGSISHEAHTTLAIAMNRIGGKSNSGEGGEDPSRYERKANGDWERSAIKQVASGRFGVTSYYLSQADELQIKMAQGAKPGEGGQLPGHKVDAWIGRVRHATPGVGLISPPPHHDIYSIEDLAQLIFDLKNANRHARISVKLVSEAGVGTIAAGVAKAHADHILVSGHDGGTGASPLSSIRHAGLPWELGLAEAHQTLVRNQLRDRVRLQVDGQIRTGRDLAIATLLGAEEWGVATAALIVEGCIMMRKCHLNTCPVGIATQDPNLRKLFTGDPEHLIHFFSFLAEDLRRHMAQLGFRTVDEMVGQVNRLRVRPDIQHWKARTLDLSPILHQAPVQPSVGLYKQIEQDHGLDHILDWELLQAAEFYLQHQVPVFRAFAIRNVNRAVGTLLSHEITRRFQEKGLPEATLHFKFRGSAGQSFAAFGAPGLRMELMGEANDYLGKGLSGSQVIVYPDKQALLEPGKNIIIGNVALYGATSGEIFVRGQAGERFAVRNSGATAVVEGVGDHGCEYMTGGVVVVLGPTGRNFAAGMSGGIAYVFDPERQFDLHCNREMVDWDPLEDSDRRLLESLVSRHYTFTGSRVALKLMTNWEEAFSQIIKVMPKEFKAARKRTRQTWPSLADVG